MVERIDSMSLDLEDARRKAVRRTVAGLFFLVFLVFAGFIAAKIMAVR